MFSPTAPVFVTDGTHSVAVAQQDAAGNVSTATSLTFNLDTHAPHLTGVVPAPATGVEKPGSTVNFTLAFDEAVALAGGTPALVLNDGGSALFSPAATGLLGDPAKLVFSYLVSSSDTSTSAPAISGFNANGAIVSDIAGNASGPLGSHGAAPPHLADFQLV